MKMRKIFSMALALALAANLSAPAFAADNSAEIIPDENVPAMVGILTDENGVEYEIVGTLVTNECTTYSIGPVNETSVTYRFDVPMRAPQNGSTEVNGPDSGYASHIYLKISYRSIDGSNPNLRSYLLTSVSGSWTIEDPEVFVTSTYLKYGCSVGSIEQLGEKSSLSNPFNVSTGFTQYIDETLGAVLGAHLTLTYLMGSSRTWKFTLNNNLFNTALG